MSKTKPVTHIDVPISATVRCGRLKSKAVLVATFEGRAAQGVAHAWCSSCLRRWHGTGHLTIGTRRDP